MAIPVRRTGTPKAPMGSNGPIRSWGFTTSGMAVAITLSSTAIRPVPTTSHPFWTPVPAFLQRSGSKLLQASTGAGCMPSDLPMAFDGRSCRTNR